MPRAPPYYSVFAVFCGHLMNSNRCMSSICLTDASSSMVEAAARCACECGLKLGAVNGMMSPRWAQPAARVERAEPRRGLTAVQPSGSQAANLASRKAALLCNVCLIPCAAGQTRCRTAQNRPYDCHNWKNISASVIICLPSLPRV